MPTEVSRTANALGVSRPTVESHLPVLEVTHALTLLRPFHGGGQKELVETPKVYAFDTGFVTFARGWDPLRPEDYGVLWEHIVLEYLQAHGHEWRLHFWRDSAGREIGFVVPRSRDRVDAIKCKWDPGQLDATPLKVFRSYCPRETNYLISPLSAPGYRKKIAGLELSVCNPDGWRKDAMGCVPRDKAR